MSDEVPDSALDWRCAEETPVGRGGPKCYNDQGLRDFEFMIILRSWSLDFVFAAHPRGSYE